MRNTYFIVALVCSCFYLTSPAQSSYYAIGGYFSLRNSLNTSAFGGFSQRGVWEGNSQADPAIWAETNYGLYFYTNGTGIPKMNITPSGKVGINYVDPSATFHIGTTTSTAVKISRPGSSDYGFEIGGSDFGLYDYTSNRYRWNIIGDNLLLNQTAGYVGIGTTTPSSHLDITSSSPQGVVATMRNIQYGASSNAGLRIGNDLAVNRFEGFVFSSSYQQAGPYYPDGASLANEGSGGISIGALNSSGEVRFYSGGNSDLHERLRMKANGNIGVGTTNPSEKFSVNGNISAKKIIVTQTGWSDYVFSADYKLRSLSEVEAFIKQYKHLPEVPSAREVGEKGISVGDNQALLLKKIEELTLHLIAMDKRMKRLEYENRTLKQKK